MKQDAKTSDGEATLCMRLHLQLGWWALLAFLSLGLVLEGLHALKLGWYLDAGNETRRLLWTLAHAHGTLLAVLQVVFTVTVRMLPGWEPRSRNLASRALVGALVLVPAGFFLGGARTHGGDPGLGALLVPPGGVLLFVAVFLTARAARRENPAAAVPSSKAQR